MKVISILGRKGGSGKSHVSHMMAYGLGQMGYPVILFQTDVRTHLPPEMLTARPYIMKSVTGDRNKDGMYTRSVLENASRLPGSILIIDGGANRRNVDFSFMSVSDLVLVPLATSPEDMSVASSDYEELSEYARDKLERDVPIYFVQNRWPGDKRRYDALMSREWVKNFVTTHDNRIFPIPVPDMPSSQDIIYHDAPVSANLAVERKAGEIAAIMKMVMKLPEPHREEPRIPRAA